MIGPHHVRLRGGVSRVWSRMYELLDKIAVFEERAAHIENRQILAGDGAGRTAVRSGAQTLGTWSEAQAENVACAGNLLDGRTLSII